MDKDRSSVEIAGRRTVCIFVVLAVFVASLCISNGALGQNRDSVSGSRAVEATGKSEATPSEGKPESSLTLEPARSVYTNAQPLHKHYFRTGLETAAFLAIAASYYYGTLEDRHWYEYTIPKGSFEARFETGDAYRLDNNDWDSNVGHIAAGTGYYLLARTNDLSLAESFLVTAGASTFWEMFGELRDEFSINDAIMTPIGGFAIGEPMFQLGEFFQHSAPSIPNRALGFLFGPSAAIHRWLDNTTPKAPENVDKYCLTTDAWHRFRVFAGGGGNYSPDADEFRSEAQMGFDFEVITAEKFGKPGEASINYLDGVFNELSFQAALDGGTLVDLRFFSKTAFLGHYEQCISMDKESQTLRGSSLFVGLSSAFEYYNHSFIGMRREDRQAICDLVGPTLIADFYRCGLHVRATAELYPSFSMVTPTAGALYDETHNILHARSVYRFESYYYALGATAGGRVEMEYGPFGLDGRVRYHYFDSIDGLDRFEDSRVTDDIEFQDQRLGLQLTLFYALPIENFKLGLSAEKIYRWSDIDTMAWSGDETRFFGNVVFEF